MTFDDLVGAFEAGDELAREIIAGSCASSRTGRSAHLIGTLSIRHIVLVGEMTRFGEPWLTAVRREAHRSCPGAPARTKRRSRSDGSGTTWSSVGAAALLMTRELGLALVG